MTDEKTLEILVDFTNALEAACVNVRQKIAELTGVSASVSVPVGADFDKLPWQTKKGMKGAYQQVIKRASSNNDIFKALQKKLRESNGFWQHQNFKYWFHRQDQDVIDRRKS